MAIYDVALMAPKTSADALASTVCQLFLGALVDAKSKAVRVDSERMALLYDPIVFIEFVTQKDLDPKTRGYHIECSAYSELTVAIMSALEAIGIPKATETGFTEVTNTTKIGVKMRVKLGYSTNKDDVAILKAKSEALIKEFTKLLDAPAKYVKIYNDKVLTADPDLDKGSDGLRVVKEAAQAGCSTEFNEIKVDGKPTNVATITRATDGPLPYRVAMKYKTDDIDVIHQLIFSARLKPGHVAPVTLVVYAGDTRKEFLIKSNDFSIIKMEFLPDRYPLYDNYFNMDIMVVPHHNKRFDIPFEINVVNDRFWIDKEIGFDIDVSSNYEVYFGINDTAKIQLAGVWVCKRGVLDVLDDPLQLYTTYPNVYDSAKSVDAAIPLNSSVKQRVETTSSNFLTKATIQPMKQFEAFASEGIAQLGQLENALKQYTTSLTGTMSSLSNLAGGKFPVLNLDKVNINFGAIEAAMGDISCGGEKKVYLQKMVNKMKSIDRAVEEAKATNEASLVKQLTEANTFANGALKDNMVNIGTGLKEITSKVDAIEKKMVANLSNVTKLTDQVQKELQVATKGLKMPDSPLISNVLQGVPGLSLPSGLGVAKEMDNINSIVSGLNSKISQAMGSINKALSIPQKLQGMAGMPTMAGNPTKAGLKTGDTNAVSNVGIGGKDYAKYWPPT